MAYEYDRFEREDGGGSFLMGLLAGTVLGAGLGMLFAPKAGSELRNQLGEQAGRLRTTAADGYQQATDKVSQGYQQATDKVSQIVDRGKEAYERARTTGPGNTSTSGAPGTTNTPGGTTPGSTGQFSGAGSSSGGYSTNRS
jgi:gas vesicle protein